MAKKSLIDDVELEEDSEKGDPILFRNQEIRKMLRLANAGKNDVFYDLGSGWGQNIIIALTEFDVKKAVGIEKDRERHNKSIERLKHWSLSDRANIIKGDFEKLLAGKIKEANLGEATIVFYGLGTDTKILENFKKTLNAGCRLVYYFNCLFPEIMPDKVNFPFYMSKFPFKKTTSEVSWLSSIVQKRKSSIHRGRKSSKEELWEELTHDYDVDGNRYEIRDYKKRLKKVLSR